MNIFKGKQLITLDKVVYLYGMKLKEKINKKYLQNGLTLIKLVKWHCSCVKHGGFKYSWKTLSSGLKNPVRMTSGEQYTEEK